MSDPHPTAPHALLLARRMEETAGELMALGADGVLRDTVARLEALVEGPPSQHPVPPALAIQRAIDASISAWPGLAPDSVVYGLVRAARTYSAAAWEGEAAIARARTAGAEIVAGVERAVAQPVRLKETAQ